MFISLLYLINIFILLQRASHYVNTAQSALRLFLPLADQKRHRSFQRFPRAGRKTPTPPCVPHRSAQWPENCSLGSCSWQRHHRSSRNPRSSSRLLVSLPLSPPAHTKLLSSLNFPP